jgi:hypothetical protein
MRVRDLMLCLLLVVVASTAAHADPSTPTGVVIERLQYSGDGCPPGSVSYNLSSDGQAFTVIYSKFSAQTGAATRRQCQLHAMVSVPSGWSYALASVDFRGFASVDNGVVASEATTYHMSGETPETTATYEWKDGFDDDFDVRDLGAASPPYWSRCGKGKNLMIRTEISVDTSANPSGQGTIDIDSTDGEIYYLKWQRCSK